MHTLNIDIETYSSVDLKTSGVYKYVEAPDFQVMLLAYSLNDEPVEVIDLTDDINGWIPRIIKEFILNPAVLKTAYNASFERTCLAKHFGLPMPAAQWECTLVKAGMLGLPLFLEGVGTALKLAEQKDKAGTALINYFCKPCKPTKTNGQRTRNLPEHATEKWADFTRYCAQDVRTEKAIRDKIDWFTIPAQEQELWNLDQLINDDGVRLDRKLIKNALTIDKIFRDKLTVEAIALTGLNNPNSADQLKRWLTEETEEEVTTLRKDDIPELLKSTDDAIVKRVLGIRQEMAKTSIKKYKKMIGCICDNGRAHGLFQFYGANRTGRWAGRLSQPHNLPRVSFSKKTDDLDIARNLVLDNDGDAIEMMFDNVPNTLSTLLRTAFVPKPGHRFIVADFSAIEARITAWLAQEKWRLDVFNTHGKIYEATASAMFRVPIDQVTDEQRQRGKVSELALGFGGGKAALKKMDNKKILKEEELQPMVNAWRQSSPAIVDKWKEVEKAAIGAVKSGQVYGVGFGIGYYCKNNILFAQLPSGRCLAYMRPKLKPGKFGGDSLAFEGMHQELKRWMTLDTYGGSLVENLVQAIARDCLASAMLAVHKAGFSIALHVHDEIVLEVPDGESSLQEILDIMTQPISWAPGLPLGADGFEGKYYKK